MELGIGSYTYVWEAGVPGYPRPESPLTFETLLRRAVQSGVSVVQIADNLPLDGLSDTEIDSLGGLADRLGVQIEVGTRGIDCSTLMRHLEIAARFGSPIVRTLLDGPSHQPSEAEAGTMLKAIAPAFEQAGVKLAIENHDRFRARSLRRIIQTADSGSVGVCLDTANSLGCGEGVEQVLDSVGEFVVNLHIKDFRTHRPPHNKGIIVEGAPAGSGLLDIPALLESLETRDMSAIVELWPPWEGSLEGSIAQEREWAGESLRYLRPLIPAGRRAAAPE